MKITNIFRLAKSITSVKILKHKLPIRVKHNITYRCNLNCPFCLLNKKLNSPGNFEMDTRQIKRMMEEFKETGTRFWSFSGGEALLREDLGELISYAKNKMDFHCSIATNGILLAERMKNEHSFRQLDLVQISLDGPKSVHDKLRGNGSFDRAILALDILRGLRIKTVIMVLLSRHNLDSIRSVIKLAGEYNTGVVFQAISAQPLAAAGLREDFFPSRQTFKKVIAELIEEKKVNPLIISSLEYLKMLRDFWPDTPHGIRCYAGKFYCDVTPEGFVVPCCAKSGLTGSDYNGLKEGFKIAFLRLDNMAACRDCYHVGPGELNTMWATFPLKSVTFYNDYFM